MAFQRDKDRLGQKYQVDWEQVNNIVCAYAYLRAFCANAQPGDETNLLGRVKTVEFSQQAVRSEKQRIINAAIPEVVRLLRADHRKAQRFLMDLRNDTLIYRARRDQLFAAAEASGKSFDWWSEKAVGATQLVRDTGFATLGIVAGFATGGWAVAATLTSATGAGWGKYQDTGSGKAAILSGAGSLLMTGWGKVAKLSDAKGAAAGVMIGMGVIMDGALEVTGAAMEGKAGSDIAKAGIMKLLTGALGAGIDNSKLAGGLEDAWKSVGNWTNLAGRDAVAAVAMEAAKKGTDKIGGFALEQLPPAHASVVQLSSNHVKSKVLVTN
jgi:hypothetical protein